MGCFSLHYFMMLCIFIVLCIGLWRLAALFLPRLLSVLPGIVVEIIRVIIWVIIAVIAIYIIFGLLSCLLGMAGGLSLMR